MTFFQAFACACVLNKSTEKGALKKYNDVVEDDEKPEWSKYEATIYNKNIGHAGVRLYVKFCALKKQT